MHYYNTYVIKNRISICADLRTAQCTGGTYTAISKIIPVWQSFTNKSARSDVVFEFTTRVVSSMAAAS